jgi:uncharacterized PurR-regulated membrane protein YhhQ (DUF165 family)
VTRLSLFALFVGTVIGANWALNHYGIITILPGLQAPAGVLFAGAAFGLRDALHEQGGRLWVLTAIAVGAVVSYVIEDAVTLPDGVVPIAVASATAFAVSELADFAAYEPVARNWGWSFAVALSNTVGAVVDSLLFLWLAFGSFAYLQGQVVGKVLMVIPALVLVGVLRRRREVAVA